MTGAAAREILERSRTIAVVGCSPDPSKAGHWVSADLQAAGFRIFPVNPTVDRDILGERCYATLADLPEPVDLVNVFRRAQFCGDVAREAAQIGAPALWLQLGIVSAEARHIAAEAGMDYVENDCTGARVRAWGLRARS